MLDFSAAFDLIGHEVLIGKVKSYGFASAAIAWIEDNLTGRKQKVFK